MVGQQVWQKLGDDEVYVQMEANEVAGKQRKTEGESDLASTVTRILDLIEVMVGLLQEPDSTGVRKGSLRCMEVFWLSSHIGGELDYIQSCPGFNAAAEAGLKVHRELESAAEGLPEHGVFGLTTAERHTQAKLRALAEPLQRCQLGLFKSLAWMHAKPGNARDPPDIQAALLPTATQTAESEPDPMKPYLGRASSKELQRILQARLQATRSS